MSFSRRACKAIRPKQKTLLKGLEEQITSQHHNEPGSGTLNSSRDPSISIRCSRSRGSRPLPGRPGNPSKTIDRACEQAMHQSYAQEKQSRFFSTRSSKFGEIHTSPLQSYNNNTWSLRQVINANFYTSTPEAA